MKLITILIDPFRNIIINVRIPINPHILQFQRTYSNRKTSPLLSRPPLLRHSHRLLLITKTTSPTKYYFYSPRTKNNKIITSPSYTRRFIHIHSISYQCLSLQQIQSIGSTRLKYLLEGISDCI